MSKTVKELLEDYNTAATAAGEATRASWKGSKDDLIAATAALVQKAAEATATKSRLRAGSKAQQVRDIIAAGKFKTLQAAMEARPTLNKQVLASVDFGSAGAAYQALTANIKRMFPGETYVRPQKATVEAPETVAEEAPAETAEA